ncbi:AAA family ATPase [Immundisolibacter sp.]
MYYIEIAEGSVKNRGIIIEKDELSNRINRARELNQELYYTVWDFTKEILEHFKVMKSIRSYKGIKHLEYIIFDIDKKEDTDEFVLRRAQEFVRRLQQDWDIRSEELRIFYSGRGYHIYMPNYFKFEESEVIIQEVKNTISEYFPEVDLAIYQPTSLIRAPYSLNAKSGRYKIPLTPQEFFGLEAADIMKLAESNEYRSMEPPEEFERDFSNYIIKAKVEREAVNYRDEPTKIVTCMQHLYNKGGTNGTRHQEGMRMISTWRRMGVPKNAIYELMKKWAPTLEEYEMQKMVNNVFDKGYRYGCSDVVMSKYCDPKCIYYTHKNYTANVAEAEDVDNLLADHAINLPFKKYIDLDKIFNFPRSYRIYEGEMCTFWGDTKVGKSTLVQNIVVGTPHIKWLYLPLENGKLLDARRLVQIAAGLNKDQIYEYYKINKGLYREYCGHIHLLDTSMDLEDLTKVYTSGDYNGIVVDTIDQMLVPSKIIGYTEKTEHLAIGFRNFARDTKAITLLIHHVSKSASEDSEGRRKNMGAHSGKGSSAIEQKSDKVISIEGERDASIRKIKSQLARDESPFEALVDFHKDTFRLQLIVS